MRIFLHILGSLLAVILLAVGSFFVWMHTSKAEDTIKSELIAETTEWGVDFSPSQAEYLGLNAEETYSAIIHDLGAKHIKIHINWNSIEKTNNSYDWSELDRMVSEAEKNNVKLILVIGMKTGRWPECHTPEWMTTISANEREEEILTYTRDIVSRYKNSSAIQYWQVENEPFVKFGKCPAWYYEDGKSLLSKEVEVVKSIDAHRKVIVSDSGELSMWNDAAEVGDIVGITMYRSSWKTGLSTFGINPYSFLSPEFYIKKVGMIEEKYGKPVICIELQAEPWTSKPLAEASISEMEKSMNLEMFEENIAFAKETNLKAFYFWGVEWWYAMKVRQNKPEIWNRAQQLFAE